MPTKEMLGREPGYLYCRIRKTNIVNLSKLIMKGLVYFEYGADCSMLPARMHTDIHLLERMGALGCLYLKLPIVEPDPFMVTKESPEFKLPWSSYGNLPKADYNFLNNNPDVTEDA